MYQVIRTDKRGRISGEVYADATRALARFILDFNNDKDLYPEILFKNWDQVVVTVAKDSITRVTVSKDNTGYEHVNFSCEDRGDEVDFTQYKIEEGYEGRYYTDMTVIDFKTGKVIGEFHQ